MTDADTHRPTSPDNNERLRLAGSRAPSEHVDGAWWPASKRLADELPMLAAAVGHRIPRIAMVAYRRDGWVAPDRIELTDKHRVDLLGFVSNEPPTVIVIGDDGHHVTLRVIDPDTDQRQARASLDQIGQWTNPPATEARRPVPHSVSDVARKLAEHEGRNDPIRDEQILQWCQDAAAQFDDAPIQTFVPILVEHIVNNRIHHERHQALCASSLPKRDVPT